MRIRLPRLTALRFHDERGSITEKVGYGFCAAAVCGAILASQGPTWIAQTAAAAISDSVRLVTQGTTAEDRAAFRQQPQAEGEALYAAGLPGDAAVQGDARAGTPVEYQVGPAQGVEPFLPALPQPYQPPPAPPPYNPPDPPAPYEAPPYVPPALGAQGALEDQLTLPLDRPVVGIPSPRGPLTGVGPAELAALPLQGAGQLAAQAALGQVTAAEAAKAILPAAAGGLARLVAVREAGPNPTDLEQGAAAAIAKAVTVGAGQALNGGLDPGAIAEAGVLAGALEVAKQGLLDVGAGATVAGPAVGALAALLQGADLGDVAVGTAVSIGSNNLLSLAGSAAPSSDPCSAC